jgi:hypothetical protein
MIRPVLIFLSSLSLYRNTMVHLVMGLSLHHVKRVSSHDEALSLFPWRTAFVGVGPLMRVRGVPRHLNSVPFPHHYTTRETFNHHISNYLIAFDSK